MTADRLAALRLQCERNLERVAELERDCRDRPDLDQLLAALRDVAESTRRFLAAPAWQPVATWRRYRAVCAAADRWRQEAERLGFPVS